MEQADINFKVAPNPSFGRYTIESKVNFNDQLYQIFDQFGRIALSGVLSGQQNEIHITEGAGLYFLKIGNEATKVQVLN
jgi:hypothetical protein